MTEEFKQALKGTVNAKDCRAVIRAVEAVEDYLPKNASSPWPKELRLRHYRAWPTLVAWDGRIGATTTLGHQTQLLLTHFFRLTPNRWGTRERIYYAIGGGKLLKDPASFDVKHQREVIESNFKLYKTIFVGGEQIRLATQDILKMLGTARSLRSKYVTACKVAEYPETQESDLRVVTFYVGAGVYVHILGESLPENE